MLTNVKGLTRILKDLIVLTQRDGVPLSQTGMTTMKVKLILHCIDNAALMIMQERILISRFSSPKCVLTHETCRGNHSNLLSQFQGGAFDAWGPTAPGYPACQELTGPNFQDVFYKALWAANAKLLSFYMVYG
jgi:hypothetical protein